MAWKLTIFNITRGKRTCLQPNDIFLLVSFEILPSHTFRAPLPPPPHTHYLFHIQTLPPTFGSPEKAPAHFPIHSEASDILNVFNAQYIQISPLFDI